mgnify:CR=1 FL=1
MNGKERIRRYLDRAFSGLLQTPKVLEAKEALYADLIEKYREQIAQGRPPEAAYQETIGSIGDVFELADSMEEDAQSGSSRPSCSGQGDKRRMLPYLILAALLLLWAANLLFPLGPRVRKFLPLLFLASVLIGGAAGLFWKRKSFLDLPPKRRFVFYSIWGGFALVFFLALLTPRFERTIWLIPVAAVAAHQLFIAWTSTQDRKEETLHEQK